MEDEITIKRSDLHHVFEMMQTINDLRINAERDNDSVWYVKWHNEWIGMLDVVSALDLLNEQTEWRLEQYRKEKKHD